MRKTFLAALVLSAVCLTGADVRPRPEGERGRDPAERGGKISAEAEAVLVKACKADLDKFCKGVETSREKKKCLKENKSALSAGCGEALRSLPRGSKGGGGDPAGTQKACKADLDKFCKGVKAGQEQGQCLAKNKDGLSPGCGKALKSGPDRREAMASLNKVCKKDLDKFCKGVKSGQEQGGCLTRYEGELSAECRKTLKGLPPPGPEGGPGQSGPGAK